MANVSNMYELVFLTGARAGEVVPVNKSLIGGRSPDCSLEIPDPNASRQHVRFNWDGAVLLVADNGSSNGTYVNDQRIPGPHTSKDGDVVRVGETRLRVQMHKIPSDAHSSSIFGFKEHETDLSQSIVMSVSEVRSTGVDAKTLAQRLNAIIQVSKALVNITSEELVSTKIIDTLMEVFPQSDRGFLMIGNEVGKLKAVAMRNRKGVTENLSVSTTICRKALESKSAFLFNDQNSGDFDQGIVRRACFLFEFDEEPFVTPLRAKSLDEFRRPDEPDPQFRFAALDLVALLFLHRRRAGRVPSLRASVERGSLLRRINSRTQIIAHGRRVENRIVRTTFDGRLEQTREIVERAIRNDRDAAIAILGGVGQVRQRFGFGRENRDVVAADPRRASEGRPRAVGMGVRHAADAIDRGLRTAGGDQKIHWQSFEVRSPPFYRPSEGRANQFEERAGFDRERVER